MVERHAFLYLLVSPLPHDFRVFLRRHAELLRALPAWSIQLLVPVEQTDSEGRAQDLADLYESAFRHELGTPLDPVTANELRWFWEASTLASGRREEQADATGASHLRDAAVSSPAPSSGTRWRARGRRRHVEESRRRNRTREKDGLNVMKCAVSTFVSHTWSARPDRRQGNREGNTGGEQALA